MKHICIYCKQQKDESEFNREHVVPRMMGTYQNGFVLSNNQVCEECNSYFSRELENEISLNSMESFLRIQYGKPMSDGRKMRKERLSFFGTEGILKGLEFTPIVDSSNEEKLSFDIIPKIGILSVEPDEYSYYELNELPPATPEVREFLKGKDRGIITVGLSQEDVLPVLKDKGYLGNSYEYDNIPVTALYRNDSFITKINVLLDSLVRRTCAKTVFNYLCYCKGVDYVLSDRFDEIREYIRYGKRSENLWFRYSKGPVSGVDMPNETAHVVGYMLFPEDGKWILCGNLTWFGKLTYTFKLGETENNVSIINELPCTKMACFDNEKKKIIENEAVYVFGIR